MHRPALQRLFGRSRALRRLSLGWLARLELALLGGHKDRATLAAIRACRRGRESLLTGNECFLLYALARAQSALDGAMAEVGVFEGVSARIICAAKGARPLHLFDTFDGLPRPGRGEAEVLAPGQFAAGLGRVRALLAGEPAVEFHPGLFPATAAALGATRFSLVHLDVDLYRSTRDALEVFYPRLVPGGVLVSHDYSILPGVARACAEFLADKPEPLIELPTTQAMFVKR